MESVVLVESKLNLALLVKATVHLQVLDDVLQQVRLLRLYTNRVLHPVSAFYDGQHDHAQGRMEQQDTGTRGEREITKRQLTQKYICPFGTVLAISHIRSVFYNDFMPLNSTIPHVHEINMKHTRSQSGGLCS